MQRHFILFLMLLLWALTGCVMAPGMTMLPPARSDVNIVPITANLIYQQEETLRKRVATPRVNAAKQMDIDAYDYKIGRRDILNITVWDHPELTIPAGEYRSAEAAGHLVAEDGTIFYPYAGMVSVEGKTVAEVRLSLTEKIARTIAKPQLDVRVAAFRSQRVYVVGEILKPGPQSITDVPLTLVDAVNQAGGVNKDADMLNVTLSRNGKVYIINLLEMYELGDISQDMVLRHGDIVHIPDRNLQKVFVLGEVIKPSSYIMHKGRMSLAEAISDAGGVDQVTSNPARIFVIRGRGNVSDIYHLNSESPEALVLGDHFKLEPRDVVYVDTAGVTRWNRVMEQLLPTSELLRNISEIEAQSFRDN